MKHIIAILILGTFSMTAFAQTAAPTTICTGKAWVRSAFVPFPLLKTVTVEMTLKNKFSGTLVLDAGGDPLYYSGPLYLDGKKQSRIVNEDSGDIIQLTLKLLNPAKLNLKMEFFNNENKKYATVGPATLTCR